MKGDSNPRSLTLADIDKPGTIFVLLSDKSDWIYVDRIGDVAICRPLQGVELTNLSLDFKVENVF